MARSSTGSVARFAAVGAVLCLVAVAIGALPSRPGGSLLALDAGWATRWTPLDSLAPLHDREAAAWAPLTLPAQPPKGTGALWLRRLLPPLGARDPAVAFDAVIGPFEVWVDDQRVYVFPEPDGVSARGPPGVPWHVVSLPADAGGRTLYLRVRAEYRPAGVRGTPLLGERADLIVWAIERDTPRLTVGALGLVLALFVLVALARRAQWRLPLGFSLYVGCEAAYVTVYTHVKDLYFDAPVAWFAIWVVALPLLPVGGFLFLDELFGSGPRGALRWCLRFHLAYALLLFVVDALAWTTVIVGPTEWRGAAISAFELGTNGLRVALLVSTVVALLAVSRRAARGDLDARIYLAGFAVLMAFAVRDIFASLGVAWLSWKSQIHVGMLAQQLSLVFLLGRRYAEARRSAAASAARLAERDREKLLMLRDLHDGVGSLATNVRLLAELGRRSDERRASALATIADLSGELLAELRAFVQTADDEVLDWPGVTAELRRFGAQVVEARGREFTMTARADAALEAPGPLARLTLLRVFREAITNATKQSAGTYVRVSLTASDTQLDLVVENDGVLGAREGGIGAARGQANLVARARELGGRLDLEIVGDTARLRFSVPLPIRSPVVERSTEGLL